MKRVLAATRMTRDWRSLSSGRYSIREPVSKDRRIVLCHATEKSRLTLACAIDHALEALARTPTRSPTPRTLAKSPSRSKRGPVAQFSSPNTWSIHASHTATAEELSGRAGWTMDLIVKPRDSRSFSPPKSTTWTISGAGAMSRSRTSGKTESSAPPSRSSKRYASIFFTSCRHRRVPKTRCASEGPHRTGL